MKGGMGSLLKHAKKMQEDLEKAQQELAQMEVVGEAGGGMVKVRMNGKHEVRGVDIDSALVGDDKDMLEDLIAAAVNDAVRRVQEETQQRFAGLATGLQGMKLPFQ